MLLSFLKKKKKSKITLRDAVNMLKTDIDMTEIEMRESLFETSVKRYLVGCQLIIRTIEELHKDGKIDMDNISVVG